MDEKYVVHRAKEESRLDGKWDMGLWKEIEKLEVKNVFLKEPEFRPKTEAKVLYDDDYIYGIFRVEDRYVRAVAQKCQDKVYEDSCVEFFFTPGPDIGVGFFNLEMNCGGTILCRYQPAPITNMTAITDSECEMIKVYHSEPKIVEPEKQEPTTWFLEYKVPYALMERYCPVVRPKKGVVWRANFYKCGNNLSRPHYLTWAVIVNPTPESGFHTPSSFGKLEFED